MQVQLATNYYRVLKTIKAWFQSVADSINQSLKPTIAVFGYRVLAFQFFGLLGLITIVLMSALVCVLLNLSFVITYLVIALQVLLFWANGLLSNYFLGKEKYVLYRQILLAVFSIIVITRLFDQSTLPYLDFFVANTFLFVGFGRIGCFMAGCCHGRPCGHGFKYPQQYRRCHFPSQYLQVMLVPVQLLEAIFAFSLAIACFVALISGNQPSGLVFVASGISYAVIRYGLEFLRGDGGRFFWRAMSEAQWTSIVIVMALVSCVFTGWLPAQPWLITLAFVFLFTAVVKGFLQPISYFCHPLHLQEIAHFIRQSANDPSLEPTILTTTLGVKLSKSCVVENYKNTWCYALSVNSHGDDSKAMQYLVDFISHLHVSCCLAVNKIYPEQNFLKRGLLKQQWTKHHCFNQQSFEGKRIIYLCFSTDYDSREIGILPRRFNNSKIPPIVTSKLYCGTEEKRQYYGSADH